MRYYWTFLAVLFLVSLAGCGLFAKKTETEDPHTIAKYSSKYLDEIYQDTNAYYGDLHVHSESCGKSDGHTPIAEYTKYMDELGMDFVNIVDHKQIAHAFLPAFDNDRMMIGTEWAVSFTDVPNENTSNGFAGIHFNMVFRDAHDFQKVLDAFTELKFKGDLETGYLAGYPRMTTRRFAELAEFLTENGAILVLAHPTTCNYDYSTAESSFFGENTYFEVLYSYTPQSVPANYEAWQRLLNAGHHIYVSGGCDTHRALKNDCISTFYTKNRHNTDYFDAMKAGNYTVGCLGMKMTIDDTPMGGTTSYAKGKVLNLRTDDLFRTGYNKKHAFKLQIVTDQGVAYCVENFDMSQPFECAIKIEDRMYYRAEVLDMETGVPVALSNPIWLK